MTSTTVPRGVPLPSALSCLPAKRDIYGSDVYYLESAEQLTEMLVAGLPGRRGSDHHADHRADLTQFADLAGFAGEHALLLLKPDAVVTRQLLPAIDWLNDNGFRIVAAGRCRLTRTVIRALWHYQWNLSTVYRRRLADAFAGSTDSLVLVVRPQTKHEVPASVLLTELKGPTNPDEREPGQLRFLLGRYCYLLNLVHTADEPADVLRELAVYFGTDDRAAVYADALTGLDRQDQARALARELYAQAPARDLDFGPAAERLAAAGHEMLVTGSLTESLRGPVRAALAEGSAQPQTWRPLIELIWAHDLAFDLWDVTTVGGYAFPMRRDGFAPVLDGVGSADWRRQLTAGPRIEFARTVDRESVHRRAVSEVFVTSAVAVDADTFDVGTQIPRQHGYFSDHVWSPAACDPMFFVEACRQGAYVIAHDFLGAPHSDQFLLRRIEVEITEPDLLAVRETPAEARIRCRLERRYRDRNGRNAGFQLRCRAHIDEREALSAMMDVRWVSPEQWAALRGAGRGGLDLLAGLVPSPQSPRLAADVLGRRNPANVVISSLSQPAYAGSADGPDADMRHAWSADIVVDPRHPTLFDHPLDHIPGMLQLEAMRQLSTAVLGSALDVPASSTRLTALGIRFISFGEFGRSARCLAWPPGQEPAGSAGADLTFRCAVRQAGVTIAEGRVRLTGPATWPRVSWADLVATA
jgi:nucleoside diphosphate kinase